MGIFGGGQPTAEWSILPVLRCMRLSTRRRATSRAIFPCLVCALTIRGHLVQSVVSKDRVERAKVPSLGIEPSILSYRKSGYRCVSILAGRYHFSSDWPNACHVLRASLHDFWAGTEVGMWTFDYSDLDSIRSVSVLWSRFSLPGSSKL